ncbi:MAG: TIGR04282 family arsenosugar biosynthesis glycosyltransferase [Betaproteobacteria bacterium]
MSGRHDTALIVFAKAPVAGLAKTRLIPALGAEGAAALAARLLRHTLAQGEAAGFGALELCATPDATHPALVAAAREHGAALAEQGEGDLGARMQRALGRRLAAHARVLLIGTDAPALDAAGLHAHAAALGTHDAEVVPDLDGGYALVGLSTHAPERLFTDIAWSTPRVMATTLERVAELGLRTALLAPLPDIDEPADLAHLPATWRDELGAQP